MTTQPLTDAQIDAISERVADVLGGIIDDEITAAAELCDVKLPNFDKDEDVAVAAQGAIVDATLGKLGGVAVSVLQGELAELKRLTDYWVSQSVQHRALDEEAAADLAQTRSATYAHAYRRLEDLLP